MNMLYCSITTRITVSNAPIELDTEKEYHYMILTPENLIKRLTDFVPLTQAINVVFGVLNGLQVKPNNIYICSIPYKENSK